LSDDDTNHFEAKMSIDGEQNNVCNLPVRIKTKQRSEAAIALQSRESMLE